MSNLLPFPNAQHGSAKEPPLALVCGTELDALLVDVPLVDHAQADAFTQALQMDGPDFEQALTFLPLVSSVFGTPALCASLEQSVVEQITSSERNRSARFTLAGTYAAHFGNACHNAVLFPLLNRSHAMERQIAAIALGWFGNESATSVLGRLCDVDSNAEVRSAAATSLGVIGDERGQAPLQEAAQADSETKVRQAALHALAQLDTKRTPTVATECLDDNDDDVVNAALSVLSVCGAAPCDRVRALLFAEAPKLRIAALAVVERNGGWRDLEATLPLRADQDPRVNLLAHETIARLRIRLKG